MDFSAIVLAAGSGKRMGGDQPKQYMDLLGKPLVFYALSAFESSPVDEIILVVAPGEIPYCRKEIVERFGLSKVTRIVEGGKERYDSVYAGLLAAEGDYVLIHDGARAFLDQSTIINAMAEVKSCGACVVGMPVKDTIKEAEADGTVVSTPDRSRLWQVQTPQCFARDLITDAYSRALAQKVPGLTDDAMVLEKMTDHRVRLIKGSYENIKVTTPEDLKFGAAILSSRD